MVKRIGKLVAMAAVFIFMLTSVAFSAPAWNLKFATYAPATHVFTKIAEAYGKRVETATGGKVKITVYPNGALSSGADQFKSVSMGAADMTDLVSDYMVGEVEMLGMGCLPLGFKWEKAHLIGEKARDMLTKRLHEDNIEYLFTYGSGGNGMFLKPLKPGVPKFKGTKIRASGVYPIEAIKAVGGVPVQMGTGEVYMAVQTGLVDAASIGVMSWASNKLYDVLPVIYDMTITPSWFTTVINKDVFDGLPKDVQKTMKEEAIKFAPVATKMVIDTKNELQAWAVKEKGCKVYKVSKAEQDTWLKAIKGVQVDYVNKGGPEAKQIWEVMKQFQN